MVRLCTTRYIAAFDYHASYSVLSLNSVRVVHFYKLIHRLYDFKGDFKAFKSKLLKGLRGD
ncbi:hypothetical protein A9264_12200 [Vibrio sp. UCD-FRSSP16_10]|nr:hypothetical protein A9260_12415 [Vibrio sp. UCD-FRSSP16_30]OBT21101.1 hypothetical protein A9264_12200 [Vibrio sp. UCD-FRSSP16_10]